MKSTLLKAILVVAIFVLINSLLAQSVFEETFDYAPNDTLTEYGWVQSSSGAEPIMTSSAPLKYQTYGLNAIGYAAHLASEGGQDVKNTYTSISGDSVYCSFMLNVSSAVSQGYMFLYLTPQNGSIFSPRFSIAVRSNSSDLLGFGIGTGSGTSYSGYEYTLDSTHLLVMKYVFNAENADSLFLFIDPDIAKPEPQPDIKRQAESDFAEFSEIVLYQTNGTPGPDVIIDGILIAKQWPQDYVSDVCDSPQEVRNYVLNQNYPNPFNPQTTISYQIEKAGHTSLKIYDISGRLVKILVDGFQTVNNYSVTFNANTLPSGVYFYELSINGFKSCKRMLLLK